MPWELSTSSRRAAPAVQLVLRSEPQRAQLARQWGVWLPGPDRLGRAAPPVGLARQQEPQPEQRARRLEEQPLGPARGPDRPRRAASGSLQLASQVAELAQVASTGSAAVPMWNGRQSAPGLRSRQARQAEVEPSERLNDAGRCQRAFRGPLTDTLTGFPLSLPKETQRLSQTCSSPDAGARLSRQRMRRKMPKMRRVSCAERLSRRSSRRRS